MLSLFQKLFSISQHNIWDIRTSMPYLYTFSLFILLFSNSQVESSVLEVVTVLCTVLLHGTLAHLNFPLSHLVSPGHFGPSGVRALPLAAGINVGGHYKRHFWSERRCADGV